MYFMKLVFKDEYRVYPGKGGGGVEEKYKWMGQHGKDTKLWNHMPCLGNEKQFSIEEVGVGDARRTEEDMHAKCG